MSNLNNLMEIKFIGKDIYPENIKVKELADILLSVEESILPIIIKDNPNISIEDIIIGLVDIGNSSTKLKFKSSFPKIVLSAFIALSSAIANNDFESLPLRSIESLKNISDFTRKKSCIAEFWTHEDSEHPLAQITPSTEIVIPKTRHLEGETILYGRVERVGGVHPKVMVRVSDKEVIYCDIEEGLAKELGHMLYTWVGISGIATWNIEDYSIESFRIKEITEYRESSLLGGLNKLFFMIGKYWKGEIDVVKAVSELRGESD